MGFLVHLPLLVFGSRSASALRWRPVGTTGFSRRGVARTLLSACRCRGPPAQSSQDPNWDRAWNPTHRKNFGST